MFGKLILFDNSLHINKEIKLFRCGSFEQISRSVTRKLNVLVSLSCKSLTWAI